MTELTRKKFWSGVSYSTLGTLGQMSFGFLGIVCAVRLIGPEDFGAFVLLQVAGFLFLAIAGLFLDDTAITHHISSCDDKHAQNNRVWTAIHAKSVIVLLGVLLCYALKPWIALIFPASSVSLIMPLLPWYVAGLTLMTTLSAVLRGVHAYRVLAHVSLISSALRFILLILLMVTCQWGLKGLVVSYLLCFAFMVGWLWIYLYRRGMGFFQLDVVKQMMRFGFPLGLNGVLTFIFMRIDRLMLGVMLSASGVALYDIAAKPVDYMRHVLQAYTAVYFPFLVKLVQQENREGSARLIQQSLRGVGFGVAFASLVLSLFREELLTVLFTEQYASAAWVLPILMTAFTIAVLSNLLGLALVALGESDKPVKINVIDSLINIIGNMVMIPVFGVLGAASATLLSRLVTHPFLIFFVKRKRSDLMLSAAYGRLLFLYFTFMVIFMWWEPSSILLRFFGMGIFLFAAYGASVWQKEDLSSLWRTLRKEESTS